MELELRVVGAHFDRELFVALFAPEGCHHAGWRRPDAFGIHLEALFLHRFHEKCCIAPPSGCLCNFVLTHSQQGLCEGIFFKLITIFLPMITTNCVSSYAKKMLYNTINTTKI